MTGVSATTEMELMHQAIKGDTTALFELLERHGPGVRQIMRTRIPTQYRMLLNDNDLMQETYAEAFLNIGHFEPRGEGAFRSWLLQIAQNNLTDALRHFKAIKRGGEYRRIHDRCDEDNCFSLINQLGDSGTTPSQGARRRELRGTLQRALQQLPTAYRQVIELYDLQDRGATEVAHELDCSPGAVFMRRRRALSMLQVVLERFSDHH